MAMTGVEIFKLLPKTNCKKCGFPTCLAFAMKLAQGQADINACPDVSDEAKATLGEASAPPVRPMKLGEGDVAVKMGEETVLFRHEKKFVNPPALALVISDTTEGADLEAKVKSVIESEIDRVGQKLRVDAICIDNVSGDAGTFGTAVKAVADLAGDTGLILKTTDPESAKAGIEAAAGKKPMLYGATEENVDAMAALAKEGGLILAVTADGAEAVSALAEKAKGAGANDLILDPGAKTAKAVVELNTQLRRAAIKKGDKSVGFPILTDARRDDPLVETNIAGIAIAKYASVILLSSADRWKNLALFAMRQNIYTDPQVPMQVEQKIYEVGEVSDTSPLLITTNFSLTYFIVAGEVENSKVPTKLAVMDCEGLSVLTAWAAGKFTANKIAQFVLESGVGDSMAEKELVIPGQVAILSGALEDKLEGWKITVGPREANQLPTYIKGRAA